ncbi:hypothetical protein X925_08890 [Petrotoga sp. 9T1HF07.CasAA.8.2]|uniref:hypothetical protein n=1 Tax=Petrotoga sp. 9T1HF07.CasAA.8.2 TaxID=1434329 RepID=UPI000CBE9C6D|nr:hypothetical protein [Petrotoga sp. 9T1HF07.CasAA.8.2]PNR87541.1 hypothetical protein X925_08890 [Petrotoga sp. 9T1HF07.CasAA.8.2]
MSEQNYRVRIKNGEVEIEAEGDKEFVEKHIKELKEEVLKFAKESPPKENSSTPEISTENELEKLSLVEFYKQKQPKDHNETVLVFAYWLTKRKKKEEFKTKDITACYDEVRIRKPKNTSQNVQNGVKKALLTIGSENSYYKLTLSGEEFVEKVLPRKGEE